MYLTPYGPARQMETSIFDRYAGHLAGANGSGWAEVRTRPSTRYWREGTGHRTIFVRRTTASGTERSRQRRKYAGRNSPPGVNADSARISRSR